MRIASIVAVTTALLCLACATVTTEKAAGTTAAISADQPYPEYGGEKKRVQVLRFGIPREIADKYPELADKRIGWGLYNRLIDNFYDTKRFDFIEEKEAVRQRVMRQWALSQSGIVVEEQQIDESRGLSLPQYLIYAEIFEFAVSDEEKVVGIAMEQTKTTRIGIQLRLVDVATGEYVPASGNGEATTAAKSVWVLADKPFDQSTVGIATDKAVRGAVMKLLSRMK
ncbi:MAG: hypothetical protein GF398_17930 [Chitinivibrionales bacterium]|nr:hypothetical protein [Chitinivibrionales bacterium]